MDDFFDDIPSTASKAGNGPDGLPPIVEVPSDAMSTTTDGTKDTGRDTASVVSTSRTDRTEYSEESNTHRSEEHD